MNHYEVRSMARFIKAWSRLKYAFISYCYSFQWKCCESILVYARKERKFYKEDIVKSEIERNACIRNNEQNLVIVSRFLLLMLQVLFFSNFKFPMCDWHKSAFLSLTVVRSLEPNDLKNILIIFFLQGTIINYFFCFHHRKEFLINKFPFYRSLTPSESIRHALMVLRIKMEIFREYARIPFEAKERQLKTQSWNNQRFHEWSR